MCLEKENKKQKEQNVHKITVCEKETWIVFVCLFVCCFFRMGTIVSIVLFFCSFVLVEGGGWVSAGVDYVDAFQFTGGKTASAKK